MTSRLRYNLVQISNFLRWFAPLNCQYVLVQYPSVEAATRTGFECHNSCGHFGPFLDLSAKLSMCGEVYGHSVLLVFEPLKLNLGDVPYSPERVSSPTGDMAAVHVYKGRLQAFPEVSIAILPVTYLCGTTTANRPWRKFKSGVCALPGHRSTTVGRRGNGKTSRPGNTPYTQQTIIDFILGCLSTRC